MTNLRNAPNINSISGTIKSIFSTKRGRKKVFILIEGLDDRKIYPKFFDATKVIFVYTGGKKNLLGALEKSMQITKRVIGICDADFNHLENKSPSIENLFFTDYHDIEMTVLSFDDVLINVLTEYELQNDMRDIRKKALDIARFIGYIRWFNETNRMNLDFDKFRPNTFVVLGDGNFYLNKDGYLLAINKRSKDKPRDVTHDDINNFEKSHHTDDIFNLCNGHDVTSIIALMIRKIEKTISDDTFCAGLRQSFNSHHFHKTRLYANISKWETMCCILNTRESVLI
jgi:hypothetical protein